MNHLTPSISLSWLPGLLLVALVTAACDLGIGLLDHHGAKASEPWTKSYPFTAGEVEIRNVKGPIRVTAWDEPKVQVNVEKIARGTTEDAAKELLKELEIRDEVTADRLRLEAYHPTRAKLNQVEVRYTLQVPRRTVLNVRTTNGEIDVDGIHGGTRAATTNGGIDGRNLTNRVDVSTTNGGITISMERVDQESLKLEATNGGIELRLPGETRADISANCTNGGISVSGLNVEASETTRRRLVGRLNGGGARIELTTTNGGIQISNKIQKLGASTHESPDRSARSHPRHTRSAGG